MSASLPKCALGVCSDTHRVLQVLTATVVLLLISSPLFSQANQGTIQGGVFDQTGGAIAGASVSVIDVARGVTFAGNPRFWVISGERLYLFGLEASRDAFAADPKRYLREANARWPQLEPGQ